MRAIVLAALMLAACAAQAEPGAGRSAPGAAHTLAQRISADMARLDGELGARGIVAAGIGESADLGAGLIVRPLEVIEDSRCPNNVQCVWAGRLRLRADLSGSEVELTLGEPRLTPQGSLVLALVSPGPWSRWPTGELGPKPAYRFGFARG